MAAGTPSFTGTAPRKLYVVAVDVSGAGTEYKILGRRVADSSLTFNTSIETNTDILGVTDTDVTNMQETQPFQWPINSTDYDLVGWAFDIYRRRAFNEFAGVKALQIHAFEGAEGSYPAMQFDNCTVEMTDLGGAGADGKTNLSITLHFGGEVTQGTVNTAKLGEDITFTAATSTAP